MHHDLLSVANRAAIGKYLWATKKREAEIGRKTEQQLIDRDPSQLRCWHLFVSSLLLLRQRSRNLDEEQQWMSSEKALKARKSCIALLLADG